MSFENCDVVNIYNETFRPHLRIYLEANGHLKINHNPSTMRNLITNLLIAQSMEKTLTSEWTNWICQNTLKDKSRIKGHTRANFLGFSIFFLQCGNRLGNTNTLLRCHISKQHNRKLLLTFAKKLTVLYKLFQLKKLSF